jgi:hypothetical protein
MSHPTELPVRSRPYIVRPLDGIDQIYENVPSGATVRDLKERIFVARGHPIQYQKLIFGPEILEDARVLNTYPIAEVNTLHSSLFSSTLT